MARKLGRERDEALSARDKAQEELADLKSLWACEAAKRQRAADAWRKTTGSQGEPSLGALLAWAAECADALSALRALWPFLEDDHKLAYPIAPAYKAALETAARLVEKAGA
jgi:hypothetical protein